MKGTALVAPTPEARALAPKNLTPEDVENYLGMHLDSMGDGTLPPCTIYNVHQVFDEMWNYQGSWFTLATEGRPTELFWMWFDSDWGNVRVVNEVPAAMYTWINYLTNLTKLYYRAYGNVGNWTLLSAGTIDIKRFC